MKGKTDRETILAEFNMAKEMLQDLEMLIKKYPVFKSEFGPIIQHLKAEIRSNEPIANALHSN